MTRTKLLPQHSGETYTVDESVSAIRAWLVEQQRVGRKGQRLIAVSFDDYSRISSVQACETPPKFRRLPKTA